MKDEVKDGAAQQGAEQQAAGGATPPAADVQDTTPASKAPAALDLGTSVPQAQTLVNPAPIKTAAAAAAPKGPAMPQVKKAERKSPYRPDAKLGETPLPDFVSRVNDPNLTHWYEKLQRYDLLLSDRTSSSIEQHAKVMGELYRAIVNIVERPATELEFANHWAVTMRMFAEGVHGGFLGNRIFIGKPEWSLGHEKFLHFEALVNLIDASIRHGKDYVRFVNEKTVMRGFTGDAQGRLGIYYRHFQG